MAEPTVQKVQHLVEMARQRLVLARAPHRSIVRALNDARENVQAADELLVQVERVLRTQPR